jgi:hypothetical protein
MDADERRGGIGQTILSILLSCQNLRFFFSGHGGRTRLSGAALPVHALPLKCNRTPSRRPIDKTAGILYNPVKKMYLYSSSMPGTQHAPSAHFARGPRPFSASTFSFHSQGLRETAASPNHLGLFSSS